MCGCQSCNHTKVSFFSVCCDVTNVQSMIIKSFSIIKKDLPSYNKANLYA